MTQVHEELAEGRLGVIQGDRLAETVIPRYTSWDNVNLRIHLVASGQDPDHPVYGLGGNLVILGELDLTKRGVQHHVARFVFPQKPGKPEPGGLELSYAAHEYSDGHVDVTSEGFLPRSKESW